MSIRKLVIWSIAGASWLGCTAVKKNTSLKSENPNILIIYTDDMGIGDLSCYNNGWVSTPNIDRLAKNGIKFTKYYTASPVCSPSRAAITTGIFPTQLGINTYLHSREGNRNHEQYDFLDPKYPSMARALQSVGYRTAHFGKWHLGGGRDVNNAPSIKEYGFEEYVTTYEGPDPDKLLTASNWIWSEKDSIKRWDRTDYFVEKTLDFLSKNQNQPAFINLWPDDMHDPWIPSSKYFGLKNRWTDKEPFLEVLMEYDRQIGLLIDGMEKLGVLENTLIIFTSDNGPKPSFNLNRTNGLRGEKNSLFEGGLNMPFLVHWPAKISPSVDSNSVISAVDLLPSLCALTGASTPKEWSLSGEDISKTLLGKKTHSRKTNLLWDFGRNAYFNKPSDPYHQSQHLAIRKGDWKLLVNANGSEPQLYNVKTDPNETKDLSLEQKLLTKQLSHEVIEWFTLKKQVRNID